MMISRPLKRGPRGMIRLGIKSFINAGLPSPGGSIE